MSPALSAARTRPSQGGEVIPDAKPRQEVTGSLVQSQGILADDRGHREKSLKLTEVEADKNYGLMKERLHQAESLVKKRESRPEALPPPRERGD